MRGGLFYYKTVHITNFTRRFETASGKWVFPVLICIYALVHIGTLSLHPFVHSDEAWLAVLSRAMVSEGTPAAVEEVFRITPRYPHALKTLYHLIQIPFLAVSWSVFSARLPSLIAGGFVLFLMTRIAERVGMGIYARFIPGILMALDPQFWYASHLGRQEMILTALFLWSWSLKSRGRRPWIVVLPLASAVFIHPNAFIVAIPVGMMYLLDNFSSSTSYRETNSKIRDGFIFAAILGGSAAAAIGFSFLMDAEFLLHYISFGDTVGTGDSFLAKLIGLPRFLGKMWSGRAGTYYLADIRPQFVLGALGFLITTLHLLLPFSRNHRETTIHLLSIPIALTAAMVIVGKYSPPTITFLMPAAYLLFGFALFSSDLGTTIFRRTVKWKSVVLIPMVLLFAVLFLCFSTVKTLSESINAQSYRSYIQFLKENINGEGRVLANLNTAFAFEYDRLVIWRDLDNLNNEVGSLESLIDEYDVRWIVLPEELEIIYNARPVWNGIYGNPRWYPELLKIIVNRGIPEASEPFPNYAMRIVPFMNRSDWVLDIYRINQ